MLEPKIYFLNKYLLVVIINIFMLNTATPKLKHVLFYFSFRTRAHPRNKFGISCKLRGPTIHLPCFNPQRRWTSDRSSTKMCFRATSVQARHQTFRFETPQDRCCTTRKLSPSWRFLRLHTIGSTRSTSRRGCSWGKLRFLNSFCIRSLNCTIDAEQS